jgi:hypothetical protein
MAKWSEQNNGKFPDPYAVLKVKVEDEDKKKLEKKLKKKKKMRERAAAAAVAAAVAAAQQIDANGNKVSAFTPKLHSIHSMHSCTI